MSQHRDMSSAEVAAAAEHERADLAHTLDQLRQNLQPRNVVDEVMSHARLDTAGVSDRIMGAARANPVAAAIIGIGAAMLFGAGRGQPSRAETGRPWTARFPSGASPDPQLNPVDTDQPHRRFDSDTRTSSVIPSTRSPMNTLSAMRHPRSGLARLIEEQPLVLAALGVAVGAAIGAALPSTEIEAEWMGDASEALKQNASAAARQQLAQLKATAGQTLDQMRATAAQHGASAENLSGLVHDLGDDVRDASQALGRAASTSPRV